MLRKYLAILYISYFVSYLFYNINSTLLAISSTYHHVVEWCYIGAGIILFLFYIIYDLKSRNNVKESLGIYNILGIAAGFCFILLSCLAKINNIFTLFAEWFSIVFCIAMFSYFIIDYFKSGGKVYNFIKFILFICFIIAAFLFHKQYYDKVQSGEYKLGWGYFGKTAKDKMQD